MPNHFGQRTRLFHIDVPIARIDPARFSVSTYEPSPCGIGPTLRIPSDIGIRARALRVALRGIRREELTNHWIIVASHIVIQPTHTVSLLAGKADAGGQRTRA